MNPWKILGVHRKSTDIEIEASFKVLCRKYHPDAGGRPEDFIQVKKAYDVLKNSKVRRAFIEKDLYLCEQCTACEGKGVKTKTKGFTEKVHTPCMMCCGAGLIIHEKEPTDVIKL